MSQQEFKNELEEKCAGAEEIVLSYLPEPGGPAALVYEAAGYSLQSGGKRLRPLLMLETCRLFGGDETYVYPFMAALEMIHTYSLIHDDLPAMDDDALRRGKPTNHVVYGEANAILAGDGLLNLAFETASMGALVKGGVKGTDFSRSCDVAGADILPDEGSYDPDMQKRAVKALYILGHKAGIRGMIAGQVADIQAEEQNTETDMDTLLFIHRHKTGALLEAAFTIGGLMGGADPEQLKKLERIGTLLGVAFQIRDDILDVTGDQEELGKPIGSDEKNNKSTYVSLKGLTEADQEVGRLSKEAAGLLDSLPGDHEFLTQLFAYLTERRK
ncbi:MAG: polyprenyl synthetase family protein [Lachnospiraceae bacterium]|nr:polyprenyl synthetase family protein [Lachnospiraceae bacterium]